MKLIRHAATLEEMKRRGRLPPGVETDLRTLGARPHRHGGLAPLELPYATSSGRKISSLVVLFFIDLS